MKSPKVGLERARVLQYTTWLTLLAVVVSLLMLIPAAGSASAKPRIEPAWEFGPHPPPDPSAYQSAYLALGASSSTDVWAVGGLRLDASDLNAWATLTAHWDGTQWSRVPSPVGPDNGGTLWDIAAISPTAAWAVGNTLSDSFVLRWNGVEWALLPGPVQDEFTALDAVSASGPGDIWAVGSQHGVPFAAQWDGEGQYSPVQFGPSGSHYQDVFARTATDVWAVGSDGTDGTPRSVVAHWDGLSWTHSVLPIPGVLRSVVAFSARDAWAVGDAPPSETNDWTSVILRWNGRQWREFDHPLVENLVSVTGSGSRNAWAVGYNYGLYPALMYWNGRSWSEVETSISGEGGSYRDVLSIGAAETWAVGYADGYFAQHRH